MKWIKNLMFLSWLLPYAAFTEEGNEYVLADHCPNNYIEAREAFLRAARKNKEISHIDSLLLKAKGPDGASLFIDIAVMGNLDTARKILFHISGTHGIEGGAGSGIQHEFLSTSQIIPLDVAIVFIHTLNPFGMVWNRRANESNVDLNRNCIEERSTSPLYALVDPVINPKTPNAFDKVAYQKLCDQYGEPAIRRALVEGQYDFPEGLFYGGNEFEEGPRLVFEWCESRFQALKYDNAFKFGIIDVHTGLGPFAFDTLITITPPTDLLMEVFGEKMSVSKQMENIGYKATGVFVERLGSLLQKATNCDPKYIFIVGQEFGTISENEVLTALYNENAYFHYAKRTHACYRPEAPSGQAMLNAFYPNDKSWKHQVVLAGKDLILKSLAILDAL